jgi:hypothetical protein
MIVEVGICTIVHMKTVVDIGIQATIEAAISIGIAASIFVSRSDAICCRTTRNMQSK